jgi:hypothetical protein
MAIIFHRMYRIEIYECANFFEFGIWNYKGEKVTEGFAARATTNLAELKVRAEKIVDEFYTPTARAFPDKDADDPRYDLKGFRKPARKKKAPPEKKISEQDIQQLFGLPTVPARFQ